MATQNLALVCDNSTLANFKSWAKPISDWFRTCGYTNTTDTGQVNWSTIAAVPGSGAFVYDIFQSGSAFSNKIFVKVEYGNSPGSANSPNIRITIASGSNGSGTLTGIVSTAMHCAPINFTAPSAVLTYQCYFTGDTANDRIGVMMWRDAPAQQGQEMIAIERSLNSSGAYTNGYATLWAVGFNNNGQVDGNQQTIDFTNGVAPPLLSRNQTGAGGQFPGISSVRMAINSTATGGSSAFNGDIAFDTCAPMVGFWDYPATMVGMSWSGDLSEGATFTVTMYGATRTFIGSKNGCFANANFAAVAAYPMGLCMRYD